MPDPYGEVQSGQPIEISATAWNSMLGAGKAWRGSRTDQTADALVTNRSSTIIKVLNDTETDLDRGNVLGLGDPIFTPDDSTIDAFLREVTFRGLVPDVNKHKRKYVVLLEPAPQGKVVRAYIAGVCPVLVDQQDEEHEYAGVVDAVTEHLKSSVHGHARILWREGLQGSGYGYYDGGFQWAVVMLGVTGSGVAVGKASGTISARSGTTYGTGHVDIYRSNAGAEDGPIETIDVLNASATVGSVTGSISSGKYCSVAWDSQDQAWVAPLECEG